MNQIIAISADKYWLDAIHKAVDDKVIVHAIFSNTLITCLDILPELDKDTLLLIDTYSAMSMNNVILLLSQHGWMHTVFVSADPSVKEVYQILRKSAGYDYWVKSYSIPEIQIKIYKCLAEIQKSKDSG